MNKKLIAVAVAGALGVPAVAWAQASTVQIYGRAYLQYGYLDQGSRSPAGAGENISIDLFQTPGSMIGFKGEEKLGGNLSAWFQCESTASISGAGVVGICGRNSAIGFKGAFGSVWFGNWDTPFKRTQGVTRGIVDETGVLGTGFLMFGSSASFNNRGTITGAAAGTGSGGVWIRRQNNTVNYETPNWSGFNVMASVSTNAGASAITSGVSGAKPRLWSLGAQYVNGPLLINGAYEVHNNFWNSVISAANPGVTLNAMFGGTDRAWHIGATYTFPVGAGLKIGGIYSRQDWDTPASTSVDRKSWQLAAHWTIAGPHQLKLAYVRAGDLGGSGNSALNPSYTAGSTFAGTGITFNAAGDNGADLWHIQYLNALSKRTVVSVGYVRLDNDTNGRQALGGSALYPAAGSNMDAWMMSVDHRF